MHTCVLAYTVTLLSTYHTQYKNLHIYDCGLLTHFSLCRVPAPVQPQVIPPLPQQQQQQHQRVRTSSSSMCGGSGTRMEISGTWYKNVVMIGSSGHSNCYLSACCCAITSYCVCGCLELTHSPSNWCFTLSEMAEYWYTMIVCTLMFHLHDYWHYYNSNYLICCSICTHACIMWSMRANFFPVSTCALSSVSRIVYVVTVCDFIMLTFRSVFVPFL